MKERGKQTITFERMEQKLEMIMDTKLRKKKKSA